ncbi:MAG: hypothetical protein AB1642_01350 [Pseudomonadota bacterium]
MIHLPASMRAWGTPDFAAALKRELAACGAALPLQQAVAASGVALDDGLEVMLIAVRAEGGCIHARVGVFFAGVVAGCNCADDPTPVEALPEYCELALRLDPSTALATVTLADD